MYTDSHCHLTYLEPYQTDKTALLTQLTAAHVTRAMAIMCQLDECSAIYDWVTLGAQHGVDIGMSIGLHPCQDRDTLAAITPEQLISLDGNHVWALGETGIDTHWDASKLAAQQHSFAAHISASKTLKKPIIVHTRGDNRLTLDVLQAEQCEHGIIHCFTEDYAFAKAALDLGLYISFSGIISFKKSDDLRAVAKKLPLDRLLIETDSPYLAPVPKRGKPNEPTFVPFVAAALGDVFGKSGEEIGGITARNFDKLLAQYR